MKTVSAFSNYNGGEIFFGIDDNGNIKGLSDVHSNICTFFNLHPIYFYRYLCYNVRKEQSQVYAILTAMPVRAILCYLVLKKRFVTFAFLDS